MNEREPTPGKYLPHLEDSKNLIGVVREPHDDPGFDERLDAYTLSVLSRLPKFAHFYTQKAQEAPSNPLVPEIEMTLLEAFHKQDNKLDYFDVGLQWMGGERGEEFSSAYEEAWARFTTELRLVPRSEWNLP